VPGNCVVLLSGGLDSTTCLALAIQEHGYEPKNITALSLYYGQKHAVEVTAAENIAGYYQVNFKSLELFKDIFKSDQSSLTGSEPMPNLTYKEIAENEGVSPTYVPFRNANLLSTATALAMGLEAEVVYFGAHAEDARGWAYPDCTPEFIGAMANAIYVGTYHQVRLATPLEWMMKKDIVFIGDHLHVPFELTHSCYEGMRPACGKCPTCIERLEAFAVCELMDPLPYVDDVNESYMLRR